MAETTHIPLPRQSSRFSHGFKDRGSLWLSGPEDGEAFSVEEEHERDWPHLVLSNVGQSILQCPLFVQGSGQALAAGKPLGQLCPVVIKPYSWWWSFCDHLLFLETLGEVTFRIWESLSVLVSLNILNSIFSRSLTGLRASTYQLYLS